MLHKERSMTKRNWTIFVSALLAIAGVVAVTFQIRAQDQKEAIGYEDTPMAAMAERVGFEPTTQFCRVHAFQACSLSHSDTSPRLRAHSCELIEYNKRGLAVVPVPERANGGIHPLAAWVLSEPPPEANLEPIYAVDIPLSD
jgi:hypothetical protein